ncbi:tripartite tricarboxylate transporter TctB family protein [Salinicoccus roseus]|uniref:Tripartite tricarboxylate transporter TctB family protein n=1 Tax=Salinicoccus roseus TaxID=45670 RepID=A0A0C2H9T9_9STAP|nr:tripartite tricarboxylate transporter TctB family protein [Salinicoccus roseus]KIH70570.1 tripartite tricarboxylate transporter TctB family protein [Salinicoccus roseus]MDB0580664.1 tripartite tricarboxylate transporter TctB family protein [Salinicoccus roseus]
MNVIRYIVPSILIVIAIIYLVLTFNLPESKVGNPTAAMNYPLLIGFSLLGLSIIYLINEVVRAKKEKFTAYNIFADKELTLHVVIILVLSLGYTLIFETVGFLISTLIFLTALLFLVNGKKKWILNIVVAVLFSFLSWYAFSELLGVSLP